jgi:hypothetical protein
MAAAFCSNGRQSHLTQQHALVQAQAYGKCLSDRLPEVSRGCGCMFVAGQCNASPVASQQQCQSPGPLVCGAQCLRDIAVLLTNILNV